MDCPKCGMVWQGSITSMDVIVCPGCLEVEKQRNIQKREEEEKNSACLENRLGYERTEKNQTHKRVLDQNKKHSKEREKSEIFSISNQNKKSRRQRSFRNQFVLSLGLCLLIAASGNGAFCILFAIIQYGAAVVFDQVDVGLPGDGSTIFEPSPQIPCLAMIGVNLFVIFIIVTMGLRSGCSTF